MDIKELTEYVRQNAILAERIAELSAIQSELKNNIREGVKELGVESDKGHIVVELNDEVSGVRNVMQQKKVSKNLDMDVAEELLKSKGLYDKCVEMVPQLNEDEIMNAYWEEQITEEDIDAMFPSKVVWALVVK
jgi:REP element-mobilizing transposase RayT